MCPIWIVAYVEGGIAFARVSTCSRRISLLNGLNIGKIIKMIVDAEHEKQRKRSPVKGFENH